MPSLDKQGELAAATIAFYVPLLAITFFLVLRHGFRKDAGWIFLLIFSLVRILGGALMIAAELTRPINTGLYTAAYILESIGLSPLLLATIGFLGLVGQHSFGEAPLWKRVFRILGLVAIVGAVLGIVGGTNSTSTKQSDQDQSKTFRRVSVILYAVLYAGLVAVHGWCWLNAHNILPHRRTLLKGISAALPFIGIRMIYSILSTFSSSGSLTAASSSSLAKFNMFSGTWWIYLVMALLMEYIAVCIYTAVGTLIPLQKDAAAPEFEMGYAPESRAYGGQGRQYAV